MVKKMDAGDIFVQDKIEILETDNNEVLFDKLSVLGTKLLIENLDNIVDGKIKGIPQKEDEVTYAWNLTKEEEKIDFNKTSKEIFNQIRGLANQPGAYAIINGEIIKIYSSKVCETNDNSLPGTILQINKKLIVKTNDSALEILLLKPSGKAIMKASDFLNGQKILKINDTFA